MSLGSFRRWRRTLAASLLALVGTLAFAGAFAAAYVELHRDQIVPGVVVAGVDLGGLDRVAAAARLRAQLPDVRTGQITIRVGGAVSIVTYSEIGRDYDMSTMLDQAFAVARTGELSDQVVAHMRTFVEPVIVPAAVTWDEQALEERVSTAIAAAASPPVDADIVRAGEHFVIVPDVPGRRADPGHAADLAAAAIDNVSAADAQVLVELVEVPALVPADLAARAATRANLIVASPLIVVVGDIMRTITTSEIARWTVLERVRSGEWRPLLDEAAIASFVTALKTQVDVPARDGTYAFRSNRPVVIPASAGLALDAGGATAAIRDALLNRASGASLARLALPTAPTLPAVSTEQAQDLADRVVRLSSWTTLYESSSRNGFGVNIRRPTGLIDGTVIEPGKQFDFVAVAGPISAANGYGEGAAIINGNTRLDGVVGGGLCTASTTVFNAALRAGFQIDARRAHAYFIDRYPVGLDATIWISGRYVQTVAFTNDSAYPILIRGVNRPGKVTFAIFGVDDGRTVTFSNPTVWNEREAWTEIEYTDDLSQGQTERVEYAFDGFSSLVGRTVAARSGAVLHSDRFRSTYRRVIGLVRVGRGPDDPPAGTRVVVAGV